MKKILSLFVIFLFIINFVSIIFATENNDINLETFDNFSIEQVQKTFSNTLSNTKTNTDKKETSELFFFNKVDYNIQNTCFSKINNLSEIFFFKNVLCCLNNYIYKYKLFEKNKFICGISEYKITFNSYFADVLFDNVYKNKYI